MLTNADFKFMSSMERRFSMEDEDFDLGVLLTPVSRKFEVLAENAQTGGLGHSDNLESQKEQELTDKERKYSLNRVQWRRKAMFGKSRSFESAKCLTNGNFEEPTPKRIHMGDLNKQQIMDVVCTMVDNENLVGDGSTTHKLPTVSGKHKDLKSITSHTVKRVIEGEYNDVIDNYIIVDCRYPYEYEGGHIVGSENLYTRELVEGRLLSNVDSSQNTIVIFHCEFSSERGPKLLRYLRSMDRQANAENYPNLYYPEIYLLDGGYKDFFQLEKKFCVPQQYKTMLDKGHSAELRHFRSKSKSWHAGDRRRCLRF